MTLAPPFCLAVAGRLAGIPAVRLRRAVEAAGGRLARRPGRQVDVLVLARGSAAAVLADGPTPRLPAGVAPGVRLVGEREAREALGFSAPFEPELKSMSVEEVARTAGLDASVLEALALYDIVRPVGGRLGFRDLLAAREVARLSARGVPLASIVDAAVRLERSGRSLADTRLAETPFGDIAQSVGGRLAGLDGQLALDLGDAGESADEVFARAEAAEEGGDLEAAERNWRRAMRIDPADPTLPFNLGNLLDGTGRADEAALAYRLAIARDPRFAEAWLNLAVLEEQRGRDAVADDAYSAALAARPGYPDAAWSRALFLTRRGRLAEAAPLWRAVLAAGPSPEDARAARRFLALCHAGGEAAAGPAGAPAAGGLSRPGR